MLRVHYNQFKGYCVPKLGKDVDKILEDFNAEKEIITDGFDQFNWDKDQEDTSGHNYESDKDNNENESIYKDEAKIHMNHEDTNGVIKASSLSSGKSFVKHFTEEEETKKGKKQAKKGRKVQKKEKLKDKKCKKTKSKNKNDNYEFNHISDASKVKKLNTLYNEILTTFKKHHNLCKVGDDIKILQFFDISIYKEDLFNMKDDEWLNDNNISFIYEYLERYQLQSFIDENFIKRDSICLLRPSMVYLLANTPDPSCLKGVLPPLEKADFIFLPINDSGDVEAVGDGSHWSLVAISMLDRKALVYDTLEKANNKEALEVIKKLIEYLNNDRFDERYFQLEEVEKTPQQLNGSDCGILTSQITSFLLSRLLNLKKLEDHFVNFDLNNVKISSIDGRIFVMGTILNILKYKLENQED